VAGLADFHLNAPGKLGGNAEPGTEDFQDERIARANEFDTTPQANPKCFQALRILVVGGDAAHDGTDVRRQGVEPHQGGGMVSGCHSDDKISVPPRKSTTPRAALDAASLTFSCRKILADGAGTRCRTVAICCRLIAAGRREVR